MMAPGFYHPIVVHFAIALGLIGVLFRWATFLPPARSLGPAARFLLVLGAAAAVAAAWTGEDASPAAESLPGLAPAVAAHRTWGVRARNALVAAAATDLLAAALRRRARPALAASALLGLAGAFCIFQAGERGGNLVFSDAAGVGVRSGDESDVGRLLLAGLVQQAEIDQRDDRPEDAGALLELAARRFPDDVAVQLLAADSLLRRQQPSRALGVLEGVSAPADGRLRLRHGWLLAQALDALGRTDAEIAQLEQLRSQFPDDERLRNRLARLSRQAPPAS
jgi:uncharacterized membrane protein